MDIFQGTRKSQIEHGSLYFWTATINGWKHLMAEDVMKMEAIQSLQWLTHKELINIYAYVIMPTHLYFVWTIKANNGRESPQGSLFEVHGALFQENIVRIRPRSTKDI